jgi:hypothetical protein
MTDLVPTDTNGNAVEPLDVLAGKAKAHLAALVFLPARDPGLGLDQQPPGADAVFLSIPIGFAGLLQMRLGLTS